MAAAQARMAPGGRRMSERPIPRPARRRMAGIGNDPIPPTPVTEQSHVFTPGGTFDIASADAWALDGEVVDQALCWIFCRTATFTAPSGWTTLASGTHSGVQYWVGTTSVSAGTD